MRSLQLLSSSALRLGSCLGHSWPWQHAAVAASYSAAAAGAAVPEAAIEVTQQGPTAVLELNRPKALNALSTQARALALLKGSQLPCSCRHLYLMY
jgi:hypothetical protein